IELKADDALTTVRSGGQRLGLLLELRGEITGSIAEVLPDQQDGCRFDLGKIDRVDELLLSLRAGVVSDHQNKEFLLRNAVPGPEARRGRQRKLSGVHRVRNDLDMIELVPGCILRVAIAPGMKDQTIEAAQEKMKVSEIAVELAHVEAGQAARRHDLAVG